MESRLSDVSSLILEDHLDSSLMEMLSSELRIIEERIGELEISRKLSSPMDEKNCYLNINAGAGGTEACDWAQMLSRMYQKWVAKRGWDMELLDMVQGEVAGIKHVTFKITAPFAYGYCKAEKGIHRLVRISPFNANGKRHTSFASVEVIPEVENDIEIQISPEDLRIDTYRASGAGGQHVNKTDSAVRITHLPSGIVVSCQQERSQLQNREKALKILKGKLYEEQMAQRQEQLDQIGGEKKEIGWGHQIRSYVFQPYTLVKDHRTQHQVGNIQAVMDGDLDSFILAYLRDLR